MIHELRRPPGNSVDRDRIRAALACGPWLWPVDSDSAADRARELAGCERPRLSPGQVLLLTAGNGTGAAWQLLIGSAETRPSQPVVEFGNDARAAWRAAAEAVVHAWPLLWSPLRVIQRRQVRAAHLYALPIANGSAALIDRVVDGPSFGLAFALALMSMACKTPLPADVAASAEVDASGRVIQVKGLAEKIAVLMQATPRVTRLLIARDQLRNGTDDILRYVQKPYTRVLADGRVHVESVLRDGLVRHLDLVPVDSVVHAATLVFGAALDELLAAARQENRSARVRTFVQMALNRGNDRRSVSASLYRRHRNALLATAVAIALLGSLAAGGITQAVFSGRSAADARNQQVLANVRDSVAREGSGKPEEAAAVISRALRVAPENSSARSLAMNLLVSHRWPTWMATGYTGSSWHPEGRLFANRHASGVSIIDTLTGRQIATIRADGVEATRWSHDGRAIAVAFGAEIQIWNASFTRQLGPSVRKTQPSLKTFQWSLDGSRFALSHFAGYEIWDTTTGRLLRDDWRDTRGRFRTTFLAPNLDRVFDIDAPVGDNPFPERRSLIDVATGRVLYSNSSRAKEYVTGQWVADGKQFVFLEADGTLRRLVAANGHISTILNFTPRAGTVREGPRPDTSFSSDGRAFAAKEVAEGGGTQVRVVDLSDGSSWKTRPLVEEPSSFALAPQGRQVAITSVQGIRVYKRAAPYPPPQQPARPSRPARQFPLPSRRVPSDGIDVIAVEGSLQRLFWGPGADRLFVETDHVVQAWDTQDVYQPVQVMEVRRSSSTDVLWSLGGTAFAAQDESLTVATWRLDAEVVRGHGTRDDLRDSSLTPSDAEWMALMLETLSGMTVDDSGAVSRVAAQTRLENYESLNALANRTQSPIAARLWNWLRRDPSDRSSPFGFQQPSTGGDRR